MNLRTSLIAALKQSRPCAFCTERIRIGTPATLVVRDYVLVGTKFEYVHPTCPIAVSLAPTGRFYSGRVFKPVTLYPADTPTSVFRMDSAYVRAGLR